MAGQIILLTYTCGTRTYNFNDINDLFPKMCTLHIMCPGPYIMILLPMLQSICRVVTAYTEDDLQSCQHRIDFFFNDKSCRFREVMQQ